MLIRKYKKTEKCGITAYVDYIISGDIHLLELKEYNNFKILSAKDYLDIFPGKR